MLKIMKNAWQNLWKSDENGATKKKGIAAAALIVVLGVGAAATGIFGGDNADDAPNGAELDTGPAAEMVTDSTNTPSLDGAGYDAESNTLIVGGADNDSFDIDVEPEDTTIDSADEVLQLITDNGLSAEFADEIKRIQSDNIKVSSQATKDIGHKLANGIDTVENDALANTFFQASYDMDGNVQAAHSIGYQALHGLGMDGANLDLAEDMLTEANDNGHKLAQAHLDYLYKIK